MKRVLTSTELFALQTMYKNREQSAWRGDTLAEIGGHLGLNVADMPQALSGLCELNVAREIVPGVFELTMVGNSLGRHYFD